MIFDTLKGVKNKTRAGGGNREHNDDETEPGEDCGCWGCQMQYVVPKHPQYIHDEDDDSDSTYARIYYAIPPPPKEIELSEDEAADSQ
jgi:hypothetical protein